MEGMPTHCGCFCLGGVASLLVAIFALHVTRKSAAPLPNGKEREWPSTIKTTQNNTSSEVKAGEPPGDTTRSPDNSDGAPSKSIRRPFPCCGPLSLSAPILGAVALAQFSSYLNGDIEARHLFGGIGPSWCEAASQIIMGCAGLVGFLLSCIALARHERYQGFALLGLLVNGPFMFLLLPGLSHLSWVLEFLRET